LGLSLLPRLRDFQHVQSLIELLARMGKILQELDIVIEM
jgi:hypothetical protein